MTNFETPAQQPDEWRKKRIKDKNMLCGDKKTFKASEGC